MRQIVSVDTETTGFGPKARVIEVAAIRWRDGVEIERFQTLVNPGIPVPEEATKIHGITDAMLVGQPGPAEAFPRLLAFVGGSDVVAHNAKFDIDMIDQELARLGFARLENKAVCTLKIAREQLAGCDNYKLATVAERLSVAAQPAHRALGDAIRCGEVYWRLRELYKAEQAKA